MTPRNALIVFRHQLANTSWTNKLTRSLGILDFLKIARDDIPTIKLNIIGPKVSNSVQMTHDGFVRLLIFQTNRHGGLITHACAYAFVCGYIVLSINFLPLILTIPSTSYPIL